jgi:hypothetical protein
VSANFTKKERNISVIQKKCCIYGININALSVKSMVWHVICLALTAIFSAPFYQGDIYD